MQALGDSQRRHYQTASGWKDQISCKLLIGLLGRRNTLRSKLNIGKTLLVKKSHLLETRPSSTPMQALAHQISSGRSTALTRNFGVLLPTICIFYQKTRLTAPLQAPLPNRVSSKMPEWKYSILRNPGLFPQRKGNNWKTSPSVVLQKYYSFFFIGPQGLLRATGRTKKLDVSSFDAEHPILLDSHYPVTRLFLKNIKRTHCHQGVDYLRALVQQQFAIATLRTALRTIVLRCVTCCKRRAETLSPMMADLPRERLAFKEPPFSNAGVDYFGPPFYVSVNRSTEKRWRFLFTCLTTRAVHFEVVPSLDTSSCVIWIESFIARRDNPSILWSGNGTNFIASEKELLQNISNWNQQPLTEALVKKRITWKFNPPSAPHHGGVWERVVRSFKHVFYAAFGNRRLTDEILITTFCLVQQSMNARLLVPASSDATDLDALTPNNLLLGNRGFRLTVASASRNRPSQAVRTCTSFVWCYLESIVERIRCLT